MLRARGVRYALTDFRLVHVAGSHTNEIALDDIADVHLTRSRLDRLAGTSTLRVDSRRRGAPLLVLTSVRRGAQLAALLDLLSGQPQASLGVDAVSAALAWEPHRPSGDRTEALAVLAILAIAIVAIAMSMRGGEATARYAPDDPIRPNGQPRRHEEVVRFMETDQVPWARAALGPIKGGSDRITCETCHGRNPDARQ